MFMKTQDSIRELSPQTSFEFVIGDLAVNQLTRFLGCLLGLAIGDAVGTTLEFKAPGTFSPIDDMIGGGLSHLLAVSGPTIHR